MEKLISGRNYIMERKYKWIIKPILFKFDPENVHDNMGVVGRWLGKHFLTRKLASLFWNYSTNYNWWVLFLPNISQNCRFFEAKNASKIILVTQNYRRGLALLRDQEAFIILFRPLQNRAQTISRNQDWDVLQFCG